MDDSRLSQLATELGALAAGAPGVVRVQARPGFGTVVRRAVDGLTSVVGGGGAGLLGGGADAGAAEAAGAGAADGLGAVGAGAAGAGAAGAAGAGAAGAAGAAGGVGAAGASGGAGAAGTAGAVDDSGAVATVTGPSAPIVGIVVTKAETRITLDIAVSDEAAGPRVARDVAERLLGRLAVESELVEPSLDLRIVGVGSL